MHDLPGEELGDGQREDVGCCRDVGDDAPHLRAGQPFGDGAETEDNLVAVDGVDVEVDCHPVTAGRLLSNAAAGSLTSTPYRARLSP